MGMGRTGAAAYERLQKQGYKLIALDSEAKIISAKKLRSNGFEGYIVSHSLYEDEANRIDAAGANRTYLTMNEAGTSLTEHICQYMQTGRAEH